MRFSREKDLEKCEFLSYFSDEELELVTKYLFRRTYKKNQVLFTTGDPRERIYFLCDGYVKLEKTNMEATMCYLDYVKHHDLFPYEGMFNDKFYHYSAYALTDIVIYYIPTIKFEQIARNNKELLYFIINRFSGILKKYENRLQTLTTTNVKDRVEQSITYLAVKFGSNQGNDTVIEIPMTITEVSRIAGTSRETVSHVFKELQDDGLLSMAGRKITVHDNDYFFEKLQ